MSDDDLDSLLDDVDSGVEETSSTDDLDDEDEGFASDDSSEEEIPNEEETMVRDDDAAADGITQAEVYENLKRIGELEDEKKRIQEELHDRTEQLRPMLKHVDPNSILYKMLESALTDSLSMAQGGKSGRKTAKAAPKAAAKKAPKKKGRR